MSEKWDYTVLIPARLRSSRYPEKLTKDIVGVPMIRRVWLEAVRVFSTAYVVGDDLKIEQAAAGYDEKRTPKFLLTDFIEVEDSCWCGIQRCTYCLQRHWGSTMGPHDRTRTFSDLKGVIVWQGDELVPWEIVKEFAEECIARKWQIANLLRQPEDDDITSHHQVKADCNGSEGHVTINYFHRNPDPYSATQVGVYWLDPKFMDNIFQTSLPGKLVRATQAELNEAISLGYTVHGYFPENHYLRAKLDTEKDHMKLERLFEKWPAFPRKV